MSVPKYRQKDSKVEFIRLLMELNIKLGKIVVKKPKKYRLNYGDRLIQTALDALELAIEGNSIYLSPCNIEDWLCKEWRNKKNG